MHLVYYGADHTRLPGDPFLVSPDVPYLHGRLDPADFDTFSSVESEFEATSAQYEMVETATEQWSTVELSRFPKQAFALQSIINAWNALASYHACLRAHVRRDKSGRLLIRVLRRIEKLGLAGGPDEKPPSEERLASVVIEAVSVHDVRLLLRLHRALIDQSSVDILKLDLALLLFGFPPREQVGFTAYAHFLRRSKNAEEAKTFWTQTLSGISSSKSAIFPRSSRNEFQDNVQALPWRSVTAAVGIDDTTSRTLEPSAFTKQTGMSRKAFFSALWAYVLSLHSDSPDVVFGTVGRDESFFGATSCLGCLDQTYLVRTRISEDGTVRDKAAAIDEFHSTASQHAHIGIRSILSSLPSGSWVESALNYTRSSHPLDIAPGLDLFPLVITICDSVNLSITITYSNTIPTASAELILEHFVTAIHNYLSDMSLSHTQSNTLLRDVGMVSPEERSRLLSLSAATHLPAPNAPTLVQLFQEAALRHPMQTAVEFEDKASVTYSQLDKLSDSLARHLSLGRGEIVALLMNRSVDLVVAILAVLKSGAAYTILSSEVPLERNAHVIQECASSTILIDDIVHTAGQYTQDSFPRVKRIVPIQTYLAQLQDPSRSDNSGKVESAVEPPQAEDRAYVIYTSGSTGRPKGSVITHSAAANGILHHKPLKGMRVLLFYTQTASAAQRYFLSTLIHGGTLVLVSKARLATDLAGVINSCRVDMMEITPTALSLLQPDEVPTLKQITVAGERIPESLVDLWAASSTRDGDKRVVRNRYGSSECTMMSLGRRLFPSTAATISSGTRTSTTCSSSSSSSSPRVLGVRSEDTISTYILREGTADQLSPTGIAGELCLAGPQLSSGYLNEPRLTARVFVDNPFGPGKMYRTGDRARRLRPTADGDGGEIEILGRIDWQVKINGSKVEPADVDSVVLGAHSAVAACATFAVELEGRQGLVLVAAVVLAAHAVDKNEDTGGRTWRVQVLPVLRRRVVEKLPAFMIPTFWLPIDQLPRNANGKVNYHELRSVAKDLGIGALSELSIVESLEDEGDYPASDTERHVANVWASVLGIDEGVIRRQHSFLGLGGHSLLAIKAISKLRARGLVVEFGALVTDTPLFSVALGNTSATTSNPDIQSAEETEPEPFSLLGKESAHLLSKLKQQNIVVEDAYPATPLQAGVLATLHQPDDPYTYQRVWNLGDTVKDVDLGRLRDSLSMVFTTHDILRTGFMPYKRSFVQLVRTDLPLPWRHVPGHVTLDKFLGRDKQVKLSMAGPFWRAAVVENKYLVVTMHHSLCDFWSYRFLYQDWAAIYNQLEANQLTAVHERPKFKNYIRRLVELNKDNLDSDASSTKKFWASALQGLTKNSTTLNHSPVPTSSPHTIRKPVLEPISRLLPRATKEHGITLGPLVYTAWAIVLSQHLATSDVGFAISVSGRETAAASVAGIEEMDGPTMSTVPLRVALSSAESTLADLVGKVKMRFLETAKYAHVGMQGALRAGVSASALGRDDEGHADASGGNLLQASEIDTLVNVLVGLPNDEKPEDTGSVDAFGMFRYHTHNGERPIWSSLFTVLEVEQQLEASPRQGSPSLVIRMSTNTMEPQRLEFLCDSVVKVMSAILEQPEKPVSSVDIVGEAERAYLLDVLSNRNNTVVNPSQESSLLQAGFEKMAKETPEAIAIVFEHDGNQKANCPPWHEQVTYSELDFLANQLSSLLTEQHGVQQGAVVALMLDKSIEAIVCILGVLKAGAAYTPLNPDNPAVRNKFILDETGARVLIVHGHHADKLSTSKDSPDHPLVILADQLRRTLHEYRPQTFLPLMPTPREITKQQSPKEQTAYILYTSGSTGDPKGIRIPHASASAAVGSMCVAEGRFDPIHKPWRSLQLANLVFDASVQDIFNTLSSGGALCLASTDTLLSDLPGVINRMGVRQVILTPTVAGGSAGSGSRSRGVLHPDQVPNLETLIVGGEPMTRQVVETWKEQGGRRVLNVYGPTETCMVVATKDVQPLGDHGKAGNIGRPFETVAAFVLDPASLGTGTRDKVVPYGAVGELCIAGPQLAEGYVQRDDLTAAAFIQTGPELGGVRAYRTGDLVRWLPGGELECLGRRDNQVHIHGYRVELGEVEATLKKVTHLVADAVVVVAEPSLVKNKKGHGGGKQQIVALCEFGGASSSGADDRLAEDGFQVLPPEEMTTQLVALREHLHDTLPSYMIPKLIVPVTGQFPRLPSRKVDRKILKRMVEEDLDDISRYILESAGSIPSHDANSNQINGDPVPAITSAKETSLKEMWAEIFDLEQEEGAMLSREANFFALGGDSIAAISLASLARQVHQYALEVPDILKHATLKDMAACMEEISPDLNNHQLLQPQLDMELLASPYVKDALQAGGLDWSQDIEYAYPCPPGQAEFLTQGARLEQMWVLQTVRRMSSHVDKQRWIDATARLSQVNEILRTSWILDSQSNKWVGVVLRSTQLDMIQVNDATVSSTTIQDQIWNERFVFPRPFIRYAMVTYPDDSWDLIIKMDHAVYDGTLFRIFDDHFAAILHDVPVPSFTKFHEFCGYMATIDKTASLQYWKDKIQTALSISDVDSDMEEKKTAPSPWLHAPSPRASKCIRNPIKGTSLHGQAGTGGITPSAIFQGAFQIWLSKTTGSKAVSFDYLLSGRNLTALPNPQTINGTVANFLPASSIIHPGDGLFEYLQRTQDDFWKMTEHGGVGLDDIYSFVNNSDGGHGHGITAGRNKVLFLYQPFNPAAGSDDSRWLIMAKSKVTMYQPYALVVEVAKAATGGHMLKLFYDDELFTDLRASEIANELSGMMGEVEQMAAAIVSAKEPEKTWTIDDLMTRSGSCF